MRTVSHYEILDRLGEGGMGVVYKARDVRLGRIAAIKVLPAERPDDFDRKLRFLQEAQTASALNHPNIVTIYEIGSEAGSDFIAMEYVAGRTLQHLIGHKPLPLTKVLKYAIQIADALAAAHHAGIVHRDLKPANVLVTDEDKVKVVDFGLAKLTHPAGAAGADAQTVVSAHTEEGAILGTAAYMSPEQAEGKPVDARSDVFSFGAVLYEMITGRQPFLRDTQTATLAAILRDDPPPPEGVPQELARVITRCLRKDPGRRVQDLVDARLVLEELKSDYDSGQFAQEHVRSSTRTPGSKRMWLVLAGTLAVVMGAAGIAWFLAANKAPAPSSPPAPLTSYLGNEVQPSFSPDGNQIAFVWDGERQDNPDIYVKLIGGAESALRLTTDPAPDISPAWSPDGRFIAFVRNQAGVKASVFIVSAIGGPERLVCDLGAPLVMPLLHYMVVAPFPLLAWASGGKFLIIADHSFPRDPLGLFVVSIATGEKRRLTSAPAGYLGDGAPAVRADGRAVIFSRAAGLTESELYRLPLTEDLRPAGEPQRLTFSKRWNSSPAWLPDGRDFVFTTSNWYLGSTSLRRMPASGRGAPRVLEGIGEATAWPAVSARAHRLVFSRAVSTQNIWRLPLRNGAAAGAPEKLIASTREEAAPQFSPDGRKIVFTSSRSGPPEVWVAESNGSNPVQLTSLGAPVTGSPHWSPDGKQIVFDSDPDGQFDVYVINAAGGSPRRLTTHPADDALASFSRDNLNIYFSSSRTGRWEVWRMPAAGGNAIQVTSGGGRAPIESPDGKLIYFEKAYGLWTIPVNGGKEAKLLDSVGFLNFAVAQKGIYFLREEEVDPRRTIQLFVPSTRSTTPVFEIGNPVEAGLDVAPDNSSLLFTNVVHRGSDLMLVESFR